MLSKGYQQSPRYDFSMRQAEQAASNAQAAGGMLGSPQHQQQAADIAEQIANRDYENYLDRMMKLYGFGLEGTQGLETQGYGASTGLAENLASALMSQGNLAYKSALDKNQQQKSMFSDIIGGVGAAAPFLFG